MSDLQDFVTEKARELDVPGVAAGVISAGEAQTAFAGVTSVENPLEVNGDTLFQFGSISKTFTATALMRLVDQGEVDLHARVRHYLPELRLKDGAAAEQVTVLQLLNHTAGWQGDAVVDTGDGDDALERYVALMDGLEQVTPPGAAASYNNASLSLAGHLIATVTGRTFEEAVRELLFEPLGMRSTFFRPDDVMTRRFVCGHTLHDGHITVARPWVIPRSAWPAGGVSGTVGEMLTWARFHLGDGTAEDGARLLPAELLARMRQPTAHMPGSSMGDAVGIGWLLKDVQGTQLVMHGGSTHGQYCELTVAPSRGFAVTCLSNCGPNGTQLNRAVVKWAVEHFLGVQDTEPVTSARSDEELADYTGHYETIAMALQVSARDGALDAVMALSSDPVRDGGEDEPEPPTLRLRLVTGTDQYVVTDGPMAGLRGYFARDDSGRVNALNVGGRLARRSLAPGRSCAAGRHPATVLVDHHDAGSARRADGATRGSAPEEARP